jgi:hypothetical protein
MKKQSRRAKGHELPDALKRPMIQEDWVPLNGSQDFEKMTQAGWESYAVEAGWCLLCGEVIRAADDLLPGTNAHNCPEGRAFEERIMAESAARGIQSRSRRRTQDRAREPHVGIFWWLSGKLIVDSTPLSAAERYANSLTHSPGHPKCWRALQSKGLIPVDLEYDEVPRGRVNYDLLNDKFLVLFDTCISAKAIRQVIARMNIPEGKVVKSSDLHYRCPRCITDPAVIGS